AALARLPSGAGRSLVVVDRDERQPGLGGGDELGQLVLRRRLLAPVLLLSGGGPQRRSLPPGAGDEALLLVRIPPGFGARPLASPPRGQQPARLGPELRVQGGVAEELA